MSAWHTSENPESSASHASATIEAVDVLDAALSHIDHLIDGLRSLGRREPNWIYQGLRFNHLQYILHYQQYSPSDRHRHVRNRLLLVNCCMSLARDFREWERRNGWQPDGEETTQLTSQNPDHLEQALAIHLESFTSLQPSSIINREQMCAGIRLGTKLLLVNSISQSLGFGDGLGLLMGFECQRLSQMSYAALSTLQEQLQMNENSTERVRLFSGEFAAWWDVLHAYYHQYYSLFQMATTQGLQQQMGSTVPLSSGEYLLQPDFYQSTVGQSISPDYSQHFVSASAMPVNSYSWSEVSAMATTSLAPSDPSLQMSSAAASYYSGTIPSNTSAEAYMLERGTTTDVGARAGTSTRTLNPRVLGGDSSIGFARSQRTSPISLRDAWCVPSFTMISAIQGDDDDDDDEEE